MVTENEDSSSLSRNGVTDPSGKKTARLEIPISEEFETEIIALATIARKSKAEWGRQVLEEAVYGKLAMLRRMAQQGVSINGMNVPSGSEPAP